MASTDSDLDDFEMIDRQEAALGPEELAKIHKWLQPTDYNAESSEFHRHLASQAPETGLWICDTPRFRQWHDSDEHGSLWIKGVPGAGKSVVAASMVKYLRSADNSPVLFFFFRYIIAANRKPRGLVRDWLAQLLPNSPRLQAVLQPLISGDIDDISEEQLWEHLLTGISSIQKAYCVVDALDEMEMEVGLGDKFLRHLNSLATFRPNSIKLLMTSRPKEYLQSILRDASIVHIDLESDLVGKDIAVFVSHRLRTALPGKEQKNLMDSLARTISARSRGLFLYARLLLDQITPSLDNLKYADIETLASTLPIGLEDMYNSMLFQESQLFQSSNFPGFGTRLQMFLLECVTHSSRLLRLNELASIVDLVFLPSVGLDTNSIPGWNSKQVARSACTPLLELLDDGTVQVIHHSFTEFLLDSERMPSKGKNIQFPILDSNHAHKNLALICLKYLQFGGLRAQDDERPKKMVTICDGACDHGDWPCRKTPVEEDVYKYQEQRLTYPFLEYAVINWAFHANHYDIEDISFFKDVSDFLNPSSVEYQRWLLLQWGIRWPFSEEKSPDALHIASFAGMTKYASGLIQKGHCVDALDGDRMTPLHWASKRGHSKMVSLLLLSEANPDPDDRRGNKPLLLAAKQNHAAVVQLLLQAGVDPCTSKTRENHTGRIKGGETTTKGETAVEYVSKSGHTETILVMLPFLKSGSLEEVLCSCARFKKFEAVRAVLENSDVSANAKFEGGTALYLAVRAKCVRSVELLLAKGADPNLTSEWEPRTFHRFGRCQKEDPRTPLHGLARTWSNLELVACRSILRLLIKAGADLEAKETLYGATPLLLLFPPRNSGSNASFSTSAMKSFLEAGANARAVCKDPYNQSKSHVSNSVLQRFLETSNDLELLNMLLDRGARIDVQDGSGDTPLHLVLSSSMTKRWGRGNGAAKIDEVVKFFLDKGAPCDLKSSSGRTPLECLVLSRECTFESFRLLLQSTPDMNARRNCLLLLESRSQEEKVRYIQELVSAGVSLESRDSAGRTPLLSSLRYPDLFQALIRCGARTDTVCNKGRGVLHHYIQLNTDNSPVERLRALVESGLDPRVVDNEGNTLLHLAVMSYNGGSSSVQLIQQLLDYGISVNVQDKLGRTPLHNFIPGGFQHNNNRREERVSLLELFRTSGDLDINLQDSEGLTLLHVASLWNEYEVAKLLTAGSDATIRTKSGRTPLHLACRAQKSGIIGLLLSKIEKCFLDTPDSFGRTPLHDACTSGRPESVYYLIRAGANVNSKDVKGRTPLHSCAEFSMEQKLWFLQKHPNAPSGHDVKDRFRPTRVRPDWEELWYTSKYNRRPPFTENDTARIGVIVKYLLAAGADINAEDSSKRTPLDLSLIYQCYEMNKALQSADHKPTQLVPASPQLQLELALKQSPPSNFGALSDEIRRRVLENPSDYIGQLEQADIEWIIKNIASNDQSDSVLGNLLRAAAEKGLTEIVESIGTRAVLYDKSSASAIEDANKGAKAELNWEPILYTACGREPPNLQMLDILVGKCGLDVNAQAIKAKGYQDYPPGAVSSTSLHRLAKGKHWWNLDAIRFLVESGADVNFKNTDGESPLHIACNFKKDTGIGSLLSDEEVGFWKPQCVELLLELGADPNTLDKNGWSPLHKAATSPIIMQTLLSRGANISAGTVSPIFSAIQGQNLQALSILLKAGGDPNIIDTKATFHLNYTVDPEMTKTEILRSALFCASFPGLHNQDINKTAPLVKLLVQSGANMYAPLNEQDTLIHYAFHHAEYEIVCSFLECTEMIKFDTRDQSGRTIFLAACNWEETLPGYRHKHWGPKSSGPLIRILDNEVDVMAISNDGRNALHHLMDNPDIEEDTILQFLDREPEKCKVLIKQKYAKGVTPFQSALRALRPEICEKLLELGADILEPDPTGATVLHRIAAQYINKNRLSRSHRHLTQENAPEYYSSAMRIFHKYLALGSSINTPDNTGSPPLFSYLSSNFYYKTGTHVEKFADLFPDDSGVDFQATNKEGETALHIISKVGGKEIFEFMAKKGLDPLQEDKKGRTALDVAAACEQKDILDLFQYGS